MVEILSDMTSLIILKLIKKILYTYCSFTSHFKRISLISSKREFFKLNLRNKWTIKNNFAHEQRCSTVLMTHYDIVYGNGDWEINKESRPQNLPLGGCRECTALTGWSADLMAFVVPWK